MGGWPANLGFSVDRSVRAVRDYLEEIRRVDISRVDSIRRDPVRSSCAIFGSMRRQPTPR